MKPFLLTVFNILVWGSILEKEYYLCSKLQSKSVGCPLVLDSVDEGLQPNSKIRDSFLFLRPFKVSLSAYPVFEAGRRMQLLAKQTIWSTLSAWITKQISRRRRNPWYAQTKAGPADPGYRHLLSVSWCCFSVTCPMSLDAWSPFGGAILGHNGIFRRWGLTGRSRSLRTRREL